MFFRQLISEIKKNIFSITFILCTCFVTIVCFYSGLYNDPKADRTYSVIECIFKFDRHFLKTGSEFASVNVFSKGFGSQYLRIFVPVLTSLPCIVSYEAVLKSNYIRYEMSRSTKNKFIFSKLLGSTISGGLVMFFGILIYAAAVFIYFPNIDSYEINEGMINVLTGSSQYTYLLKSLLGYTVYGMISVFLPIVMYESIRNISVTESIVFMAFYIYFSLLNKFEYNDKFMGKYYFLFPNAIVSVFTKNVDTKIIFFNFIFVTMCFSAFYFFKIRKSDISE